MLAAVCCSVNVGPGLQCAAHTACCTGLGGWCHFGAPTGWSVQRWTCRKCQAELAPLRGCAPHIMLHKAKSFRHLEIAGKQKMGSTLRPPVAHKGADRMSEIRAKLLGGYVPARFKLTASAGDRDLAAPSASGWCITALNLWKQQIAPIPRPTVLV